MLLILNISSFFHGMIVSIWVMLSLHRHLQRQVGKTYDTSVSYDILLVVLLVFFHPPGTYHDYYYYYCYYYCYYYY